MLAIEVEFLTGVSVAASPSCREQPEWPPHPDRLFQALVAAWGRNDSPDDDERQALEWLERFAPQDLAVSAPRAAPRDVAMAYVPPNDASTTSKPGAKAPKELDAAVRVLPELRKNRQPRKFPAMVPISDRPQVHYTWDLDEAKAREFAAHRKSLERLASEVIYIGHSHTLVRVALIDQLPEHTTPGLDWVVEEKAALRVPHPGRLKHLCDQFAEFSRNPSQVFRPRASLQQRVFEQPVRVPAPGTLFDGHAPILLSDAGGFVPALAAFPLVAKRLRDALLNSAPKSKPIPALLSGHDSEGRPSGEAHMAIVPLADVGWQHSQGRLMGLALLWPRQVSSADRQAAVTILAAFLQSEGNTTGLLHFGRHGSWSLTLDPAPERASRRFPRYVRASRRWGTVLPMVLDRYPKTKPGENLPSIIAQACMNIGLPKEAVDGLDIEVHKHAAVKAAPSVGEVLRCLPEDSPYRCRPAGPPRLDLRSTRSGAANPGRGSVSRPGPVPAA